MKTEIHYRGYIGSAEVDTENHLLVGKLLYIRDTIAYSAQDPKGLEGAFREAVDEYLQVCEKLGQEPEVPCKGSFNVRVGEQRHRDAAVFAGRLGITLNEFVCRAIDDLLISHSSPQTDVEKVVMLDIESPLDRGTMSAPVQVRVSPSKTITSSKNLATGTWSKSINWDPLDESVTNH